VASELESLRNTVSDLLVEKQQRDDRIEELESERLRRDNIQLAEVQSLTSEKAELQARTKTTLTPVAFITMLTFVPIAWMFVALGGIIVWKTTSNPSEVAPHLDIILVAFAIFSGPVVVGVKDLMSMMAATRAEKKKPDEEV